MFDEIFTSPQAMLIYGLLTHFLFEFARLAAENEPRNILCYLFGTTRRMVQSAISIIGALAGYAALFHSGDLSPITAFGVGYMANTVPDLLGKRAGGKL